jgi:hypothetical protein
MTKKVFRIFVDVVDGQEKWLNKMSEKGLRLTGTSRWHYIFETCKPAEYSYRIVLATDKPNKELEEYRAFLLELGIKSFTKNIHIGKYAYGSVRMRFSGKGITLATSPGSINKELLILEKKNDGPFEVFTELSDKISYCRQVRNAAAVTDVLVLALMFAGTPKLVVWGRDYSHYLAGVKGIGQLICLSVSVLLTMEVLKRSVVLYGLKKEAKIHE